MTAILRLPDHRLAPYAQGYRAAARERRRQVVVGLALALAAALLSAWAAEVDLARLAQNVWRFPDYFLRIHVFDNHGSDPAMNGRLVFLDVREWFWGWRKWGGLLLETLLIAYVGTLLGALGAFALCFHSARNLGRAAPVRWAVKRFMEFCRTVPEIVFALIFVIAFGLGPFAGVLAIAIHTVGALGKLFAEVVENVEMGPVEGVAAAGATWTEGVRFAVLPQVLSNFASYALLRFEINVRGAAVMGFVGAGGIGQDLLEAIRKFYYADVSALLVMIIATVMVIDLATERVRHGLIGSLEGRA